MIRPEHRQVAKKQTTVRALGGLTFANSVPFITALVTAPILARALGPSGRGVLAAVLVPLSIAPIIAQLGVGQYVVREAARGRPTRELVGSIGLPLLLVGVLVAIFANELSTLFIPEGHAGHTLLRIGFSLLPITLFANLLQDIVWGRQGWRVLTITRFIPPTLYMVALVPLAILDEVTVTSALIALWAASVLVFLPLRGALRDSWVPHVKTDVMKEGFAFGMKSWFGALSEVANLRLDQLLMIGLVSRHDLGLYAVAVNVATVPTLATSAFGSYVLPRVAGGDEHVVGRASRVGLIVIVCAGLLVALASPIGVPLVFGDAFSDSLPMVLILLLGLVPMSIISIINPALGGAGVPIAGTYAEIAALTVTVPGLLIALPLIGAIGAAIVSSVAYAVSAIVLLVLARRRFSVPFRELLVPTRADFRWLRNLRRSSRPAPEVVAPPEPASGGML
jgi:O-antigen/teichoic acid export membrane protein